MSSWPLEKRWAAAVAAVVPLLVSWLFGLIFKPDAWFKTLRRPSFMPPNWVFAVVWTILYPLLGVAMVAACYGPPDQSAWTWTLPVINIIISLMFSPVMFYFHSLPGAAFITWLSLAMGIGLIFQYIFANHSALAAWLTAPYVLWLVIASALAFSIWRLNSGNNCTTAGNNHEYAADTTQRSMRREVVGPCSSPAMVMVTCEENPML